MDYSVAGRCGNESSFLLNTPPVSFCVAFLLKGRRYEEETVNSNWEMMFFSFDSETWLKNLSTHDIISKWSSTFSLTLGNVYFSFSVYTENKQPKFPEKKG